MKATVYTTRPERAKKRPCDGVTISSAGRQIWTTFRCEDGTRIQIEWQVDDADDFRRRLAYMIDQTIVCAGGRR